VRNEQTASAKKKKVEETASARAGIEVRPERVNGPISRSKFLRETVLVSYIDDQLGDTPRVAAGSLRKYT
jgi:hypothetical protein